MAAKWCVINNVQEMITVGLAEYLRQFAYHLMLTLQETRVRPLCRVSALHKSSPPITAIMCSVVCQDCTFLEIMHVDGYRFDKSLCAEVVSAPVLGSGIGGNHSVS